jgi:hypothetical protein
LALLAFLNRDPHLAVMTIDSNRLKNDSADAHASTEASGLARWRTGATAVIEPVLPIIYELRARGYGWKAIAAALAKQGVIQGINRKPLTSRRLTALISAINKRVRRHQARMSGRAKRRDLAPLPPTLALSTDLHQPNATTAITATDGEVTIRHQEYEDRIRSLLKADTP